MTDPDRLRDGSDLRATLLRSARHDRVPTNARGRALAAALAASAALGSAPATGAAAAGVGVGFGLKVVVAIGVVVAVVAPAVAHVRAQKAPSYERAVASPVAPSVIRGASLPPLPPLPPLEPFAAPPVASSSAPETAERAAVLATATVSPLAHKPADAAASSPPASASGALALEVSLLEEARRAIALGRSSRALDALDRYTREVAHPQLTTEAELLRIDALEKNGDGGSAAMHAHAFVAAHPRHPAVARLVTAYP